MASTEWKTWNQVAGMAPGNPQATLIQLCGKAAGRQPGISTTRSMDAKLAGGDRNGAISSVDCIGTASPGPSWKTIAEHGQHAVSVNQVTLWDQALDRESAGSQSAPQGGLWPLFHCRQRHHLPT